MFNTLKAERVKDSTVRLTVIKTDTDSPWYYSVTAISDTGHIYFSGASFNLDNAEKDYKEAMSKLTAALTQQTV